MFRNANMLWGPILVVLLARIAVAADAPPPASTWLSQDALIVVEVPQVKVLLEQILSDRVVQRVTALPAFQQQAAKPEFQQGLNLIKYFEGRYEVDLRTLLGKLLGGGITWALGPNQTSVLIIDADDAKMLDEIHDFFLLMARNDARSQARSQQVTSSEYRGVTVWSFGGKEAHAIIGNRLLLSNEPKALETVLDLRAEPARDSLAKLPGYQAAKDAAGTEAVATAFANASVLKQLPQLKRLLQQSENPLAALLLAPLLEGLRESTWLGIGVDVEGEHVKLQVAMDRSPAEATDPQDFATPKQPDDGALPNLTVPRRIAGFSVYRDLHKFYAAKDDLFPERTSGLIFFENMMGIFFSGRDLTEEVLAQTTADIRLVVAEQRYDANVGAPQIQIPGFAAVFRLRNPKKFSLVAEEAWQKALGLVNFTRGQQALPGLIIDRPTHAETKYTKAFFIAYSEEQDTTAVDVRFNFQPSLAMPGDYLILSSCDSLAQDLIDALKKEASSGVQPLAGVHSLAELDGGQLASILRANREALVRQNMVEKGNTREQSESELNVMLTVLQHIDRVKLNAARGQGQSKLTLDLDLNWP